MHTLGKIWVNAEKSAIVHAEDGRIACRPNHMQRWAWTENSRRLVACWNACDGLLTDELEKHGALTINFKSEQELISQRDALLDALKVQEEIGSLGIIKGGGGGSFITKSDFDATSSNCKSNRK